MTDWAATATASTAISPWASRRDELVRRTVSIAADTQQRRLDLALPSELTERIDRAERRAEALAQAAGESDEARRAAALEFLAETVTALVLDRGVEPGGARELVGAAAAALEIAEEAAALTVFMRALASADVAQLPPHLAVEMLLELVVELGPADAVSLFTLDGPSGQLECAASSGEAPRSRRMRAAGRAVLEAAAGLGDDDSHIRAIAVTRWDKPFAALVARCGPGATREVGAYLAETGSALSPLFEREMLFERNAARERTLVSASVRPSGASRGVE
jgi:hypothetical protein